MPDPFGRWRKGYHPFPRSDFFPPDEGGCSMWNEPRVFSEWEAYVFLRLSAFVKPKVWELNNKRGHVQLQAGETRPLSVRMLMARWGWGSKKRITAFIARLTERSLIGYSQTTVDGDTYLIADLQVTQNSGDTISGANGDRRGYSIGDSIGDTYIDGREVKTTTPLPPKGGNLANGNGRRARRPYVPTDYPPEFELVWQALPKRPGNNKAMAFRQYENRRKEGHSHDAMLAGAEAYFEHVSREGTADRHVQMAQTFLGEKCHFLSDWSPVTPVIPLVRRAQ